MILVHRSVTQARIQHLSHPKYGFSEILLPEMLLRLKQGTGRLIRSATDTGVIAILDPRAPTKPYHKTILATLPKAKVVRDPPQALENLP